jgi:biopolymer transport protein ExbD
MGKVPPEGALVVRLIGDRILIAGDREVTVETLGARLKELEPPSDDARVWVVADKNVPYRPVMDVMTALQDEGYFKVALVAN